MSKQLSPEEQREIRARYGSDVQTLDQAMNMACEFVSKATGFEVKVQPEDRLRAHIIEAAMFLRQGAPGRALEVLERALR